MLVDQILHKNLVELMDKFGILHQTFYVGGMVRDHLLGRTSRDIDIVVENITKDQLNLLTANFKLIGQDFPVFTFEVESSEGSETIELAVARKERSTGVSHTDFEVEYGENISLNNDLSRRDITINSMAVALTDLDKVIDIFGGVSDLASGTIRHTTDAFSEDPLRVFRVARFAARYDFKVDPETITLMKSLVIATDTISQERVFAELQKVFSSAQKPSIFFRVLRESDNLSMWFPILSLLIGLPHIHEHDVFEHTMNVVDNVRSFGSSATTLFGAVYHDMGKIFTDTESLPRHIGHDISGLTLIPFLTKRLKMPKKVQHVISDCVEFHLIINRIPEMRPAKILKLVKNLCKRGTLEDVLCLVRADRLSKGVGEVDPVVFEKIRVAELINKKQVPADLQKSFSGKTGVVIASIVEQWRVSKFKMALA